VVERGNGRTGLQGAYGPVRFAEKPSWKVLFTNLLLEKNIVPWLINQADKFKPLSNLSIGGERFQYVHLSPLKSWTEPLTPQSKRLGKILFR
jgi:hypothetical protein